MDAGARGRRLLQRKEYAAKVSGSMDRVPDDIRDWYEIDENFFTDLIQKAKDKIKSNADARKKGPLINGKDPNFLKLPPETQQRYTDAMKNSYEPEGEMVEANAEQMKAMHDAKMRKKEDDMKKKKKVDEECWDGYEKKGMKTMFGKRYPNCVKKTKKEEVQLEAKKSCGEGEYYCHDRKKCMPIPKGAKVGKDGMLVKEDMKGMSQKSGDKRSTESGAGMTAQGVAKYNRRTGGNLKTAVTTPPSKLKPGSKAAKRRKSFCARSKSWTGPRGKAARRRWNCSYEPELPMIIDEKKLYNGAPLSDRVAAWARKINEKVKYDQSMPYIPNQKNTKTKETKLKRVNYGTMAQSYVPQGEMVERKMTGHEKDKKEDYVKGMKKDKKGFTKRYGKDAKSVMYATATKMAMKKEAVFNDPKLNKMYPNQPQLTQKGATAFKNIPDPNIFRGGKKIGGGMVAKTTDFTRGINAITGNQKRIDNLIKQMNSYEPEGQMIEAKDEKKKSVKGIAKELDKAVAMHKSQAKRLRSAGVSEDFYQKRYAGVGKGYKTVGKNREWISQTKEVVIVKHSIENCIKKMIL